MKIAETIVYSTSGGPRRVQIASRIKGRGTETRWMHICSVGRPGMSPGKHDGKGQTVNTITCVAFGDLVCPGWVCRASQRCDWVAFRSHQTMAYVAFGGLGAWIHNKT